MHPLRPQHALAIDTIKRNRAFRTLDTLEAYQGKLQLHYQCVWCQADDKTSWIRMFALDLYDWKDLGSDTAQIPARGCTGIYLLSDGFAPEGATINLESVIAIPNVDGLDPFGA